MAGFGYRAKVEFKLIILVRVTRLSRMLDFYNPEFQTKSASPRVDFLHDVGGCGWDASARSLKWIRNFIYLLSFNLSEPGSRCLAAPVQPSYRSKG